MSAPRSAEKDAKAVAASEEAQRRIAKAARERKAYLDLSNLGLTSVPPEIGQFVNLTELNLNHCGKRQYKPERPTSHVMSTRPCEKDR